MFVFLSHP